MTAEMMINEARIAEPAVGAPLVLPFDHLTPETIRFAEAWSRWRGGRMLPRRSDMRLPEIKHLLPLVSLLEVRGPTDVVFRVAGSRMRDYLGMDLTGCNYIDLAPEPFRPIRTWRVQQEVTWPCGALFIYPHRYPSGYVAPAEVVSLPVDDGRPGRPPMLLSLVTPMTNRLEDPPEPGKREVQFAVEFAFIDLGAGIPDRTIP